MWDFAPLGLSQLVVFLVLMMEGESGSQLVPQLPSNVALGVTSTYNLWTHALRQQKDAGGKLLLRDAISIQTLLSPDEMLLVNLAPMDGPHPLYSNDFMDLRTEFLLDYMIQEPVGAEDPRMTQPGGLAARNLNGKSVTFKKDQEGKITVEGVKVSKTQTLNDGVTVYHLSDLLFDHRKRTQEALAVLNSRMSPSDHFGFERPPPLHED